MTYDQIRDAEEDDDFAQFEHAATTRGAVEVDEIEPDDDTLSETDLMVMLSGMVGGVRMTRLH